MKTDPNADVTTPTPKQPALATDTSHTAFLLLVGQVIGVLIAAWVAGTSDRVGTIVIAVFVVLWLIWIMSRTDVLTAWGAKVGLPTGLTPAQAKRGLK